MSSAKALNCTFVLYTDSVAIMSTVSPTATVSGNAALYSVKSCSPTVTTEFELALIDLTTAFSILYTLFWFSATAISAALLALIIAGVGFAILPNFSNTSIFVGAISFTPL